MKNKFSERLVEAMDKRNLKPIDLARMTGIDKGAISCYCSGKYRAGQRNLYRLSEALHVDPAWLMGSDQVEMEPSNNPHDEKKLMPGELSPNDIEKILLRRYRRASEKTKKAIDYILKLDEVGDILIETEVREEYEQQSD